MGKHKLAVNSTRLPNIHPRRKKNMKFHSASYIKTIGKA